VLSLVTAPFLLDHPRSWSCSPRRGAARTRRCCARAVRPRPADACSARPHPQEAVDRARETLTKVRAARGRCAPKPAGADSPLVSVERIPGGVGAYSDSRSALMIRKEVAAYIKNRDGLEEDPNPDGPVVPHRVTWQLQALGCLCFSHG
jgi:hypothetical protein